MKLLFAFFLFLLVLNPCLKGQEASEMINNADAMANNGKYPEAKEAYLIIPDAVNVTPEQQAHLSAQSILCDDMLAGIANLKNCEFAEAEAQFGKHATDHANANLMLTDIGKIKQASEQLKRGSFGEAANVLKGVSENVRRLDCTNQIIQSANELSKAKEDYDKGNLNSPKKIFNKYDKDDNEAAWQFGQKIQALLDIDELMTGGECEKAAVLMDQTIQKFSGDALLEKKQKEVRDCVKKIQNSREHNTNADQLFNQAKYAEAKAEYSVAATFIDSKATQDKIKDCEDLMAADLELLSEQSKGCAADFTKTREILQRFVDKQFSPAVNNIALIGSLEQSNQQGRTHLRNANEFYEQGDYKNAITEYGSAFNLCQADSAMISSKIKDCIKLRTAGVQFEGQHYDFCIPKYEPFAEQGHAPSSYYLAWTLVSYRKQRNLARAEGLMETAVSKKFAPAVKDLIRFDRRIKKIRRKVGFNVEFVGGISIPASYQVKDVNTNQWPAYAREISTMQFRPNWFAGMRFRYQYLPVAGFMADIRYHQSGFTWSANQTNPEGEMKWSSIQVPIYATISTPAPKKFDEDAKGAFRGGRLTLALGIMIAAHSNFAYTEEGTTINDLDEQHASSSTGFAAALGVDAGGVNRGHWSLWIEYFSYNKYFNSTWNNNTFKDLKTNFHNIAVTMAFRFW